MTRHIQRGAAAAALLALALAALLTVLLAPVAAQNQLEDALARAVRMYRVGYASEIDLADFTDFNWDRVFVFPPYTALDTIDAAIGYGWARGVNLSLPVNGSVNLLVFIRDGRVVRHIEMPRSEADFSGAAEQSPFTPQTARFFLPDEDQNVLGILR